MCVALVGCGRVGFDPLAGDASARDAATSHVTFGVGSAALAGGGSTSLQAQVNVEAGDLVLVGTSFDTAIMGTVGLTLSDSFGDSYSTVAGPLHETDLDGQGLHQSLAAAAAGSAGTVTVSAIAGSASYSFLELEVVTYRDTATLPFGNALAQLQAQGSGTPMTDPVPTATAGAVVVGYVVGIDAAITAGSGATVRAEIANDLVEDVAAPVPGNVSLTFGFQAGGADAEWVVTAIVLN